MSSGVANQHSVENVALETEFLRLVKWWDRETGYFSNLNVSYRHPAFRAIVALGAPALPILLRNLQTDPGWWFEALHEITGANPLRKEDAGKFDKMVSSWIQWGFDEGYISDPAPASFIVGESPDDSPSISRQIGNT